MDEDNYGKVFRIYLQDHESEAIPMKFYRNTPKKDVEIMIQESISNLKLHSRNPKLRAWQGSIVIEGQPDWNISKESIILSENQPKPKQKPALQTPYTDPKDKIPHKADHNLALSTPTKTHKVNSKPQVATGQMPTIERAASQTSSPTTNVSSSAQKKRSGSAAKYHISLQKAQNDSLNTSKQDMGKPSMASVNKQDASMTFNPIKGQSFIADQSSGSSHVFKSNTHNGIAQLQHDSSHIEESKILMPITPKLRESSTINTGYIGTKPIDGNVPHVYSLKRFMSPFSYFVGAIEDKYNEKLPPPLYLDYDLLAKSKDFSKENVLKGLKILPTGELKLVDEEILKTQKGILTEVFSSLLKSIAEGRGVVGVSLPVRIFEPRSLLERMCDWWTFLPQYIVPAAQITDPIERMKRVISMAIGGLYVSARQLKPFNPLLGETFQGVFPDHGITIDSEHTSHHPPIANFLLKHRDFSFWGRYEFQGNVQGLTKNVVIVTQIGPNHVDFKDGHRITFHWPSLHLEGVTHGDRTCTFINHMKFVDEKNKIKVIIRFGESGDLAVFSKKRTDAFCGKMYRYKEHTGKKKVDEANYGDLEQEICSIHGSWLEYLKIGNEERWNINRDVPAQYTPVRDPLPSDARFREDLLWVKHENKKHAHEWKLKLEERQRYEKKLRTDYQKQAKKH